jgi:hypothetical protein
VFGGVERESGRTFLVPVPEKTADTLVYVIHASIETGTTLISDCCFAYRDIGSLGYTHRAVNHNISFVNPDTVDHTNTSEHQKVSALHFLTVFIKNFKNKLHHFSI